MHNDFMIVYPECFELFKYILLLYFKKKIDCVEYIKCLQTPKKFTYSDTDAWDSDD